MAFISYFLQRIYWFELSFEKHIQLGIFTSGIHLVLQKYILENWSIRVIEQRQFQVRGEGFL